MKTRVFIPVISIIVLAVSVLSGCMPSTGQAVGWPGISGDGDKLYMVSLEGDMVAVNATVRETHPGLAFPSAANGEWVFSLDSVVAPSSGGIGCSSAPSISVYGLPQLVGEAIYLGLFNGKVLAINPSARGYNSPFPQAREGEWMYPSGDEKIGAVVGGLAISDDKSTIYVSSSDGVVYALDAVYGDLKWKSEAFAGDRLWTTPVVDGDKIYVSSFDGCLYVLSAEDGQLLPWRFEAESGFASSPAVYDGLVFIGSFDHNLYALRAGSDEPVWKLAGGNWFWASPVVSDGIVYAGCTDGLLYAVDAASGQEIWPQPFATSGSIVASPLLVGNVLVVACDSGDLYLVDAKTGSGERIGNPQFPGSTDRTTIEAAVLASLWVQDDHIAYIHAQNDRLYALDIASREVSEVLSFREG